MSGSASPYLQGAWLRHVLGIQPYMPPGALWLGLQLSHPDDGPGAEVTGPGYARQLMGAFAVVDGDPAIASNVDGVDFGLCRKAWGLVTHAALYDAAAAGNELAWSPLIDPVTLKPVPIQVGNGVILQIHAGQLQLRAT